MDFKFLQDFVGQVNSYGVNPWVFIIIYLVATPSYYLGIYLIGRGAMKYKRKCANRKTNFRPSKLLKQKSVINGFLINRASWGAPYVYVIFVGNKLPVRFYVLILLWSLISFYLFLRKIKKKHSSI